MDMVGMVTAGVVGALLFSLLSLRLLSLLLVVVAGSSENCLDVAWSSEEEELFTVRAAVGVVVVGSFVVVIIRDGITSALAGTGTVVQELLSMSTVLIEFGVSFDSDDSCELLVVGAW